jgi:hypothetical protein
MEWECETCDRVFASAQASYQHMNALGHWAPTFDCEACDQSFESEQQARIHMDRNNHWRKHFCNPCNRGFQNENNLRMVSKVNNGQKKSFSSPRSISIHACTVPLVHHVHSVCKTSQTPRDLPVILREGHVQMLGTLIGRLYTHFVSTKCSYFKISMEDVGVQ